MIKILIFSLVLIFTIVSSHIQGNIIFFVRIVFTRASFCCAKKIKKLPLFLTKVAKLKLLLAKVVKLHDRIWRAVKSAVKVCVYY